MTLRIQKRKTKRPRKPKTGTDIKEPLIGKD